MALSSFRPWYKDRFLLILAFKSIYSLFIYLATTTTSTTTTSTTTSTTKPIIVPDLIYRKYRRHQIKFRFNVGVKDFYSGRPVFYERFDYFGKDRPHWKSRTSFPAIRPEIHFFEIFRSDHESKNFQAHRDADGFGFLPGPYDLNANGVTREALCLKNFGQGWRPLSSGDDIDMAAKVSLYGKNDRTAEIV